MIKHFARLSIRWKLLTISVFSSLFSLFLAILLLLFVKISALKQNAQDDLTAIANLIANRSTAAVMFDDPQLAKENLGALKELAWVNSACIYKENNQLFTARLQADAPQSDCPAVAEQLTTHFERLRLFVFQPMMLDMDRVGSVFISSDLSAMLLQELRFIGLVLLVLFVTSCLALMLTAPMLNRISKPIARLANTAYRISNNKDYSLRAEKSSDDEVGVLVDAFNKMISTVDEQNNALIAVKNSYLALYDNNPTMVFNLAADGTIVSVNRFGAKQLDLTVEQLQGRSLFDFIHPDDTPQTRQFLDKCQLHPQQIHKQEIRKICRDGRIIWVRSTARMITDEKQLPYLLLVCEDVTETRRLAEKIAYQASHDELTGLVNRRQFDNYIQHAVEEAHETAGEHALCYLDLDQFKVVNDTCGHLAGDELLRQLGEALRQQIRKNDVLARLGGDEFGILMRHCSLSEALNACEKLRNIIRDFQFAWDNRSFSVGVSIGIASINSISGNAVDVLKEADAACYAAKERGRNRVHVYHPDDEEMASRQGEMQWVAKIQHGIENQQFCLYGQLIVPIADHDEGLHFETLIRYRDEHGKIVPPGAFLSAAERYNLAPALDRWVIANIFEFLRVTPGFLDRLSLCSINLSGLSMSDEQMLAFIDEQFANWQIPTHKICFEITETAAITNLSYAKRFMENLRNKGCLFSLDDFGSGLSSFAYLKNLSVDFLKIDGLFVKDILDDRVDLAMVKSINEVGHVMEKKTIAEFVESQDVFERLRLLGVDYAQGYGIAKPVPLQEL